MIEVNEYRDRIEAHSKPQMTVQFHIALRDGCLLSEAGSGL